MTRNEIKKAYQGMSKEKRKGIKKTIIAMLSKFEVGLYTREMTAETYARVATQYEERLEVLIEIEKEEEFKK